jgi:ABC-type lipoprotein export system ATPase subunit
MRLNLLGYIFQEYALLPELTALENVLLPAIALSQKAAKEKSVLLLQKVGLGDRLNHLPRQLSGGEQQKVAIARALINDPIILLADEPTANLDSVISKEIMEIFKKLNQDDGLTIVMISHEEEETLFGSRIITMKDGKIK